jgi:ABC-type multidrug transport system ATPase subunit
MQSVIVTGLEKSYRNGKKVVPGIRDIAFTADKGSLFGVIGPDGSGKTTLFRILTTLILADKGTAIVDGFDVVKDYKSIRNRIGYMPGRFSLYQDLTVEENLSFFATIFNTSVRENYSLIKDIYSQIEPFKNRKAGNLSGGMKQKLALSCALIHRPSVLFLDEPTTGVDAVSRKEFWQMLKNLQQQGVTILVSTPYMDEAALCDTIALIQNGKFLSIDSPQNTRRLFSKPLYSVRSKDMFRLQQDLKSMAGAASVYPFGSDCHLALSAPESGMSAILEYLRERQHTEVEVRIIQPDIEDVFMELMTHKHG